MRRLLACALLLMTGMLFASPAYAVQGVNCDDIAAYLLEVDARSAEHVFAVISDPAWQASAETAIAKAETLEDGMIALSREEAEPMIQYLAVGHTVLSGIEPETIPDDARELHDSATEYWAMMNDLFTSIFKDGPFAAFAYLEQMESLTNWNWAAQEEIRTACPDVIAPYVDRLDELTKFFAVMDGEGDMTSIRSSTVEDVQGMGYTYLFFADEEDVTGPPASPVSTPAS